MPNKRGENQKLLTVPADAAFIRELDRHLRGAGYDNRSKFIREAIVEKLERHGIRIPKELAMAPQRTSAKKKRRANLDETIDHKIVEAVAAAAGLRRPK